MAHLRCSNSNPLAPYPLMLKQDAAQAKSWLVTGGAGFIGSHLVETLLHLGQRVVVLDNLSTGSKENLDEVVNGLSAEMLSKFHFINGDICDIEKCKAACSGVDYVLHHASFVSVPLSLQYPSSCNASNVTGFLNVALASREAGVRRFVYASSSAVYGDDPALPKKESHSAKPISVYGASKLINEIYASALSHGCSRPEFVGLRYFNVFGPRQNPFGGYAAVIPKWVLAMMRNISCSINGDGSTTRDFCPVEDVVQANILAATSDFGAPTEWVPPISTVGQAFEGAVYSRDALASGSPCIFNVARGEETTLLELHEIIAGILDKKDLKPVFYPDREGDIHRSVADIQLIKNTLGFEPSRDLKDSMRRTVDWYKHNSSDY